MKTKKKKTWEKIKEWMKYLKNRLMVIILFCGLLPLIFIVAFVAVSYRCGIIEKTESMMENELQYTSSMIEGRLNDAIAVCQMPAYNSGYEEMWLDYQKGTKTESEFRTNLTLRLGHRFNFDRKYDSFAFYEVNHEEPVCYGSRVGHSYKKYMKEIDPAVENVRVKECPDAQIQVIDGHIFIIQNLYTTSGNEKFATLAVEINQNNLFRDIKSKNAEQMALFLNESENCIVIQGTITNEQQKQIEKSLAAKFDHKKSHMLIGTSNMSYSGYAWNQRCANYDLGIMCMARNEKLYMELYDFYRIIALIILIMIPVCIAVIYFLNKHISDPIMKMIETSKAIEEGAIGTIIEDEKMPNVEFEYLKDSFNKMSKQVKYLFDYAYDEKMARKDAKIMALQAQINPHFLNNTLEMMNWQARISGNLEVSSMIESLGIVLDYNMNRESKKLASLTEELRCADAYFHIISKRFGKRLTVEKEIDQELLSMKVPQLVLQPIIENAVVHGIERAKSGVIKVKIYSDDIHLYLQVKNTGKPLTKEEKQRIETLLERRTKDIADGSGNHVSLAIYNVNERVKLIYGKEYGLEIKQEDEYTVSTITIPIHMQAQDDESENREKIRKRLEANEFYVRK